VYPGEFHLLERPSFIRNRQQRWLAWFGEYIEWPLRSLAGYMTE